MTKNNFELKIRQEDAAEEYYYSLAMLPYPSGSGLHVGHVSNFVANDVHSRYMRMSGKKVLNPIGWDAFGLPAENYAMQVGGRAADVITKATQTFSAQLQSLHISYDRGREINTSTPEYYKWTQWIFRKLYQAGLVYKNTDLVNRCPNCQTVLANDQVVEGMCERCNTEVTQKKHPQRFIKITDYAERLLADLDTIDRPEETKKKQRNRIGKSEGAYVDFSLTDIDTNVTVFTTRPDTIYGVTALVLSPEHPLLPSIVTQEYQQTVTAYQQQTRNKTLKDRQYFNEGKTGVFTGAYAINPMSYKHIPIWIADYVLPNYATGSIMLVPAHDERDNAFAIEFGIDIISVIDGKISNQSTVVTQGIIKNSGPLNGMNTQLDDVKGAAIDLLEEANVGKRAVTYKLRDWSVSRQRYRGSPIPIYYDEKDIPHLIPEKELPVLLPLDIENYRPSGVSPLEANESFQYYNNNEKNYRREYDTLDTFVCSSFYYLRYIDPNNETEILRSDRANKLLPVDFYIGGKEHSVGHLLYARFIYKFLYDQGYVPTAEPFQKLIHQGMVLAADGRKMSKRLGNVVNPDSIVQTYGADACRTYVMFMGPIEQDKVWNDEALNGTKKFLDRAQRVINKVDDTYTAGEEVLSVVHATIKKWNQDMKSQKYNTAIAKIMEFVNFLTPKKTISSWIGEQLLLMLAPFAPQMSEQGREQLGKSGSIHVHPLPKYDENAILLGTINLPVQINGKMKGTIEIEPGLQKTAIMSILQKDNYFSQYISKKSCQKIIFIQDKIINIIV